MHISYLINSIQPNMVLMTIEGNKRSIIIHPFSLQIQLFAFEMLLQTNFCKNQYPWAYKTNLLPVNMVHVRKNLLSWVNGMKWFSLLF